MNLVPPGATVTSTSARTTCRDTYLDDYAPALWREFDFSGTADAFLDFYRTALPQAGWTLTADINEVPETLDFSRSFGNWNAEIIVADHELIAEPGGDLC